MSVRAKAQDSNGGKPLPPAWLIAELPASATECCRGRAFYNPMAGGGLPVGTCSDVNLARITNEKLRFLGSLVEMRAAFVTTPEKFRVSWISSSTLPS